MKFITGLFGKLLQVNLTLQIILLLPAAVVVEAQQQGHLQAVAAVQEDY